MTQKGQIYKCKACGNIIEVLHSGASQLVCCGEPMTLLEEKNQDEGLEKHVPVIEELSVNGKDGVIIKVGEIAHPMEKEHYIEWIEITTANGKTGKKFLKPQDKPQAEFCARKEIIAARIYCNIHGLWTS